MGAVVSQDKQGVLRHLIGVSQGFLGVGGVEYFPGLDGAVYQEGSILLDGHKISGSRRHPTCPKLAVQLKDHHIPLLVYLLQAEADGQVSVLQGGEHTVSLHLGKEKDLGGQQPAHQKQEQDSYSQGNGIPSVQKPVSPAADDGTG